jgi:hypothetical protein
MTPANGFFRRVFAVPAAPGRRGASRTRTHRAWRAMLADRRSNDLRSVSEGGRRHAQLIVALGLSTAALLLCSAPALAAAPETPELTVESPVHATTATFLGVLNPLEVKEPNNKGGTYKFFYRVGAACKGAGGHETKPAGLWQGLSPEPVSASVTGLTSNTNYTVCLSVTNLEGETTLSAPIPFKTATPPEKPETKPATGETGTTAILHGVLNPIAEAETGWYFAFSTGAKCTSGGPGGGETAHEAPAKVEALAVETEATPLEPNKTYKFCLLATSELSEPTVGNEVPFKTLPLPPVIASESTSAVKATEATLEAKVNPNNEKTKYVFEYSTKETGGVLEAPIVTVPGAAELEGFPEKLASVALTGLAPGTTYFYRVVAENAQSIKEAKPAEGTVQSFTTVPTPFTDAVDGITTTFAVFHGHLTPLNPTVATQYHFNYKLGGGVCTNEHETTPVEAGTGAGTEVTATAGVLELQPNAEYTVCFVTSNASGSAEGSAVHFTTAAVPPRIVSVASSAPSPTGVTLEAVINPNNQETKYTFEYATSEAALLKGEGVKGATGTLLPEFAELPVSEVLSGLTPDTTYFFRVIAENAKAERTEALGRASTQGPPLVTTEAPQSVTSLSADLAGTVYPGGLPTTYSFLYVPASEYEPLAAKPYANGTSSEAFSAGPDSIVHPVLFFAELKPGETYDYTVVATNGLGTVTGPNQVFATPALPPPPAGEPEASNPSPGPSPFAAGTLPAVIPFQSIAQIEAKEPKGNTGPPPKKLTKAQLLAKALKACNKKPRKKRAACRRAAKRRYR